MFSQISWSSYWTVVIVATICYYLYVGLVYYRQVFLKGIQKSVSSPLSFIGIEPLTDEMEAYFDQAYYSRAAKAEILLALRQILQKYDPEKVTAYQQGINKLIRFKSKEKCAVTFSDEELQRMWMV